MHMVNISPLSGCVSLLALWSVQGNVCKFCSPLHVACSQSSSKLFAALCPHHVDCDFTTAAVSTEGKAMNQRSIPLRLFQLSVPEVQRDEELLEACFYCGNVCYWQKSSYTSLSGEAAFLHLCFGVWGRYSISLACLLVMPGLQRHAAMPYYKRCMHASASASALLAHKRTMLHLKMLHGFAAAWCNDHCCHAACSSP